MNMTFLREGRSGAGLADEVAGDGGVEGGRRTADDLTVLPDGAPAETPGLERLTLRAAISALPPLLPGSSLILLPADPPGSPSGKNVLISLSGY
ncbi:hypothetical protein ABGB17_38125 [Sphaerisporangium sp. B11E5]|uniref:hypothetical protein n=1 Tax=Sphaerisporangium sp. B11E5 TaxID=3153563 RepID=UPI00325F0EE3